MHPTRSSTSTHARTRATGAYPVGGANGPLYGECFSEFASERMVIPPFLNGPDMTLFAATMTRLVETLPAVSAVVVCSVVHWTRDWVIPQDRRTGTILASFLE